MSIESDQLLSVTGLAPKSLLPALPRALRVQSLWSRRLAAWLDAEQAPWDPAPPPADFEAVFAELATPIPEETWTELLRPLTETDPALAAEYRLSLTRARAYLVGSEPDAIEQYPGIWPRRHIETFAGQEPLPLSEEDKESVWAVLAVLQQMERFLTELDQYAITPAQVLALKTCVPDLYTFALGEVSHACEAKGAGWLPEREQEMVMRVFQGKTAEANPMPPPPPAPMPAVGIKEIDPNAGKTAGQIAETPKDPNA